MTSLLIIVIAALATYGFMTMNLAYIIGGVTLLLMILGLMLISDINDHCKRVK